MTRILSREARDRIIDSGEPLPETTAAMPVWFAVGQEDDPNSVLEGIWRLGGATLHVLAFAVHIEGEDGRMEYDTAMFDAKIDWQFYDMEGHAETIEIDGRRYVVFAYPFSG